MKKLPNGLVIFNATPHTIRFWQEGWDEPVEVEPDEVINATIEEEIVAEGDYTLVQTVFKPTQRGFEVHAEAKASGADLVVGSIIAAQAYPGLVVAMTPAPGFERVPPAQKRMNPGKFTVFPRE